MSPGSCERSRGALCGLGLLGLLACRSAPAPQQEAAPAPAAVAAKPAAPQSPESPGSPDRPRLPHIRFAEQFSAFEKDRVNPLWRCLFGRDRGDGHFFRSAEQLNLALEDALFTDPRAFPSHVIEQCLPHPLRAARSLGDLEPEPPPEYRPALADYGKALTDLASALSLWAEGAAPRIESKVLEKQLVQDGEAWSTTNNLSAADPVAWRYDAFLHCAVPELDRLKDSQALLETLATRCIARSGQPADAEFLERLHGTCLPAAKTSPAKAPPRFKATWDKLAADYDRLSQGFGVCFRRMNKTRKRPGLEELDSAWERSLGASSQIRQLLSAQLGAADKR